MSQSTYCNPRLYIEDVGIIEDISGTINFPGTSQIISLDVKIPGINQPEAAMMDKEVRFYLNYGTEDSVPFFIGFIKEFTATDKSCKIKAYDSRCFLGGAYAESIELDEDDNYDGYTLGQFLYKHIQDNVNTNKTYIDLSLMNDTEPPVRMQGVRALDKPYGIALESLKEAVDDSDIFDQLDYEIGMTFGSKGASIKFIKQQDLKKGGPSFSYGDGITSYKYKKRLMPNRGKVGNLIVDLYSTNNPRITKDVEEKIRKTTMNATKALTSGRMQQETLKGLLRDRAEKYTININATKGHYLQLGSIVYLNVDEEFKGNHRITSKSINFSSSGISLKIGLSTRPSTMSFNNSY